MPLSPGTRKPQKGGSSHVSRSWGGIVLSLPRVCCAAALCWPPTPRAAAVGEATASVTLQPTILRVQVPIFGVGKTVAAALENSKTTATAVQKLKSLGAIADSIVVGKTTVNSTRGPSTYNAPGFAPPGYPAAPPGAAAAGCVGAVHASVIVPPVAPPPNAYAAPAGAADWAVVSATVSADCPLEAEGPTRCCRRPRNLRHGFSALISMARRRRRRLSRRVARTPPPAVYLGYFPRPVSMPQFYYVAKVSSEQRQAALAEAFAKAKTHATELAAAVGAQRPPRRGQ